MWVNIRCVLIAPAKIPECEGSISLMGTINHTFYSPIYPVDERNEDVGGGLR